MMSLRRSWAIVAMLCVPATVCADGLAVANARFSASPARDATADEAALRSTTRVYYVFEVNNPGDAAQVRVQWTFDGRNLPLQTLDVGARNPHWRLWSVLPRRTVGHRIDVTVTDAAGATLHTDHLALQ